MALRDLTVYQKHYDLILYAIPVINRFPKSQRYVLGQQAMNTLVDIAKLIIQANRQRGKNRLRTLWVVDQRLEEFRLLIRLAKDRHMLAGWQYGLMAEMAAEVGRLLGDWIKQTRASLVKEGE